MVFVIHVTEAHRTQEESELGVANIPIDRIMREACAKCVIETTTQGRRGCASTQKKLIRQKDCVGTAIEQGLRKDDLISLSWQMLDFLNISP